VLKVLGQEEKFDSLHWFESITFKFAEEQERLAKAATNEDIQKMQQISIRKIQAFKQEYQLLQYCFMSARIFFSDT